MTASATALRASAVVDFAHALVVAALNRLLHARDSRFVLDAVAELTANLRRCAQLGVDMPLGLGIADDCLFHGDSPLAGPSLQARSLLRCCSERDIGVLSFQPLLGVEECNRLLDLLLLPQNRAAFARSNRDAALSALGIKHVRVTLRSPAAPDDRRTAIAHGADRAKAAAALHTYQDLAESLQQNHARAHRDQELAVDQAAGAVERTVADLDEPSMLLALATQDDVDRFTVGHSVRVALLALQVARAVGASREQLVQVGSAALLHDIGKSRVPQEVLFKQGRLDADEWAWMAQHPRLGAQILLEQHETVDRRAIGAAFCHHMRTDGGGYPKPQVPVSPSGTSRLVRVCDVFEALTSVRPYKKALTPVEAYAVMFRNEGDFDPQWLRAFVRTLGLFPTGSRVSLADGAEAIVVAQTGCPESPIVQLLTAAAGSSLPSDHPQRVRVGERLDGRVVRIAAVTMHERLVAMPEFDPAEPQILTQTAHGACLSSGLAHGVMASPQLARR